MSTIRAYLANPHKIRALQGRLLRPFLRKRAIGVLCEIRMEELSRLLSIDSDAAAYFRHRGKPVFFFDEAGIPGIVSQVSGEEMKRTVSRADEILRGVFTFRSIPPVHFGNEIDWTRTPGGNGDWNADLNRLDFLVTLLLAGHITGSSRYAAHASRVLVDWVERNGPGLPVWSDIFEAAQRINTLSWILFLGRPLAGFGDQGIRAAVSTVLRSGCWIEANLEYHIPNNHLLIEALRLAQAGLLFPEYYRAGSWFCRGLNLLEKEVRQQVLPDGVHAERSVFYQRMVLEALLEIIVLLRRNAMGVPCSLEDSARRMLRFLRAVRRPDGSYPLVGDGFEFDILLRYDAMTAGTVVLGAGEAAGAADGLCRWFLNGRDPVPKDSDAPSPEGLWRDGGYAVFRRVEAGADSTLLFDFGKFGMEAAPGHGHCDCLSMELTVAARPILVDAGSFSWGPDAPFRNAFRGTRAHNTIAVDGREQTPLCGIFGAGRFAAPTLKHAVTGSPLQLLAASHDGYARLREPVIHTRAVLETASDGWLVLDRLSGRGTHFVELFWHFHPDVQVTCEGASEEVSLVARAGAAVRLKGCFAASCPVNVRVERGGKAPPVGWMSPESGLMVPADTLIVSARVEVPAWVLTAFSPVPAETDCVRLERIPCEDGLAFLLETARSRTTAFFAVENTAGGAFGRWRTNASVAAVREGDHPAVLLAGGGWIERKGGKRVYVTVEVAEVVVD